MGLFSLLRFTSPNAGVSVSEVGTDLSTTAALGQAVQNFDTHAANKDTTNTFTAAQTFSSGATVSGGATINGGLTMDTALAIANGGTGAAALTQHGVVVAGASALTTVAPGNSGNVLTSNGTDWASAAASGASLTLLGPTFATVDTSMTDTTSWFTGVTLGTALTNGKTYLLVATVALTNGDFILMRIFDSTNSVEIVSTWLPASSASQKGGTLVIPYSGFAGTPTIVVQCKDPTASGGTIKATVAATSKATSISALQIG